jgi:histidinol-phosphate/aromatic aminotransferase/cobyric acid decarboxylase-like protein
MHPDAIPAVEGSACDDPPDPSLLDFSGTANPERPAGVAGVYDAAFGESRTYPSNDYTRFREAAAAYVGCAPPSVVPTAGGLRAIRLALGVAVSAGDSVLVPVPSYGEHHREIRLQGGRPTSVPYEELLHADPTEHAAVLACNPNDPTGDVFPAADMEAFAERCRDAGTTLVLDEALIDFSDAPSLAGTPGVVVVRSLSKIFGLPGLRAGFAVATGDHRDRLVTARQAWGLAAPAAAVGVHCMTRTGFVERTRDRTARERERMRERLSTEYGVHPADANILLLDVDDRSVPAVVERARDGGVAVRDATDYRGLDSHVRVAVRKPDENDRLLDALLPA